VPPRGPRP
jgi:sugar phosphate isomerase/epimerase